MSEDRKYSLSKQNIAEAYEDLFFREAMAMSAEEESAEIEAELLEMEPLSEEDIERKNQRRTAKEEKRKNLCLRPQKSGFCRRNDNFRGDSFSFHRGGCLCGRKRDSGGIYLFLCI